jgi:hypothetical protein
MNKSRREPQTHVTPDPRVFSDYKVIIFDPDTLDVINILHQIPKGVEKIEALKRTFKGLAFTLYKGKVPEGGKSLKFVDNDLIKVKDPNITAALNTPFALMDPQDFPHPVVFPDREYILTIKSTVENGRIYRHTEGFPVRLKVQNGTLSRTFIAEYDGKATVRFSTKGLKPNTNFSIQISTEDYPQVILLGIVKDTAHLKNDTEET